MARDKQVATLEDQAVTPVTTDATSDVTPKLTGNLACTSVTSVTVENNDAPPTTVRDDKGRFLTGNNGGGRPAGSRNKLTDTFLAAIADDFAANGLDAIARVRESEPATYLKLVSSLIPRQLVLQREREPDFTDMSIAELEELRDRVRRNHSIRKVLEAESR